MLKIISGSDRPGNAAPGQVINSGGEIVIGTGQGVYAPKMVQLAGKKAVGIEDFVRGYADFMDSTLK
jgi:methionyl-tRNA formyltransferase